MSYGYLLRSKGADLPELVDLGVRAEELGFDALWLADSPLAYGQADPLMLLAAIAARTERITIGTAVLLAALREPVLLAHGLATLDRIAAGRLVAGFGSGFAAPETERMFAAVGAPYDTRVARLREIVAALRALWAGQGEPVSFAGRHVAFEDVRLAPPPTTPTGPPIWLAGAGEKAERRAGALGDGWLPYLPTAERYAEAWEQVQAGAAEAGRPAPRPALYLTVAFDDEPDVARARMKDTLERWYGYPFDVISSLQALYAGTPEGLHDHLAPYRAAGAEHIILRPADDDHRRGLEALHRAVHEVPDEHAAEEEQQQRGTAAAQDRQH
jgi:probable F420-dependent oxidoreductase